MQDIIEKLKKNWELAVLLLAILFSLCMVCTMLGEEEALEEVGSGKMQLQRNNLLSDKAFDFLALKAEDQVHSNPFKLAVKAPEPPKAIVKPPAKPAPKPQPVAAKKPEVKELPTPKPEPKPVDTKPQPKAVKGKIAFLFQQNNQSGKAVAVITVATSPMQEENLVVAIGDEVQGAKILAISEEELMVLDTLRNRKVSIPAGESRLLMLKK